MRPAANIIDCGELQAVCFVLFNLSEIQSNPR